jgi:hypothetical protein
MGLEGIFRQAAADLDGVGGSTGNVIFSKT